MKTKIAPNIRFAAIALALICAVIITAHAATITVTNTNDSGAGSLRQALATANDGDTITFAVSGTIVLTSGELLVDKNITISGPGAGSLAVDGNANSRVFHVGPGKTVAISGLTITNGYASGESGGGIYNDQATLTLSNCTISGNSGGGVYNGAFYGGSAVVEITNSTISDNSTDYSGAGIYSFGFYADATLTLSNCTISGNFAEDAGGAISNVGYGVEAGGCGGAAVAI